MGGRRGGGPPRRPLDLHLRRIKAHFVVTFLDGFVDNISVVDPETSKRGPRNMKYKPPTCGGHLFMTIFYRSWGYGPLAHLDPLLYSLVLYKMFISFNLIIFLEIWAMVSNYKFLHLVTNCINVVHNVKNTKLTSILSCYR